MSAAASLVPAVPQWQQLKPGEKPEFFSHRIQVRGLCSPDFPAKFWWVGIVECTRGSFGDQADLSPHKYSRPLLVAVPTQVFEAAKAKRAAERAALPEDPINVKLPDGTLKPGIKGKTTPFDIAMGISKGLAENAVVAKVDGKGWDMKRPLEGSCAWKDSQG